MRDSLVSPDAVESEIKLVMLSILNLSSNSEVHEVLIEHPPGKRRLYDIGPVEAINAVGPHDSALNGVDLLGRGPETADLLQLGLHLVDQLNHTLEPHPRADPCEQKIKRLSTMQ